jgi:hypothetical protein
MPFTPDQARQVSRFHSTAQINDSQLCWKLFPCMFYSLESDWEPAFACFTPKQQMTIRRFADRYFAENHYEPSPDFPVGDRTVTAEQTEELIRRLKREHKDRWMMLHQWIIQATGA